MIITQCKSFALYSTTMITPLNISSNLPNTNTFNAANPLTNTTFNTSQITYNSTTTLTYNKPCTSPSLDNTYAFTFSLSPTTTANFPLTAKSTRKSFLSSISELMPIKPSMTTAQAGS